MSEVHKVIIIGSGPAGYTAAIYAARARLKPVVFSGGPAEADPARVPGGQLMITTDVENYPGFPEAVTGPELMERFQKQAERFGTVVHLENVVQVDFSQAALHVTGESGATLTAQTVIVATGASAKWLGVKGEDTFKNRACRPAPPVTASSSSSSDVVVVGGGDTAMEEATYLSKLCASVTLVHRRDELSRLEDHARARAAATRRSASSRDVGDRGDRRRRQERQRRGGEEREDRRDAASSR